MAEAQIRIGTSGWHYKHWVGDFYPKRMPTSRMFPWYASKFDTVEINNTFYRLPTDSALLEWRRQAPANFLFSVKASRFITHMKRLRDPEPSIERFFSRIALLKPHLGPILFQLPPRWHSNPGRLEEFLEMLPRKYQYVFEFRDPSWYSPPIYDLLRRHNIAACIHDWRGMPSPTQVTANFVYIRFHGPTGHYSGNYPTDFLQRWAKQIQNWQSFGRQVWVYFNNDTGGHAIRNAQTLQWSLHAGVLAQQKTA